MDQNESKNALEDLNCADYCDAIAHQAWLESGSYRNRPYKKDLPKASQYKMKKPGAEDRH